MKQRVSQTEANFQLQTLLKQGFVVLSTRRDKKAYYITLEKNGLKKNYSFTHNGWLSIT